MLYRSTLEIALWGVITLYLLDVGGGQFHFMTFFLGAIIFWNFLIRIQHGITVSFLEDVWARNFMHLFSSPLSFGEYLLGLLVMSVFQTIVAIGFMALLAWTLFAYNIFQFGVAMIPFVAVLFVFGWALGVLTVAIILRLGPSSDILAWSIPALFMPLVGVFYPVSTLPKFLQPLSWVLPPTYVFEGLRGIVASQSFDSSRFITALLLAVILLVLAYLISLRSYRWVLRTGRFTRFMTE